MPHPESVFSAHVELHKPNSTELRELHTLEPEVEFAVVPYAGLSEGRQSRVSVLEYRSAEGARRVLWKRMGVGKGLTEQEAEDMHAALRPYRADLNQSGWHVPELFYTNVVDVGGEHQIFSYEELVPGGDAAIMTADRREPSHRKWFMIQKVVETLAAYPAERLRRSTVAGKTLSALPHGLDLKLANLVLDPGNQLHLVDLFGPKQLGPDLRLAMHSSKLDKLPEESLRALCATREGTLLRFYRLAEQTWSSGTPVRTSWLRHRFKRVVEEALPRVEYELVRAELDDDYPWLSKIYSEQKV